MSRAAWFCLLGCVFATVAVAATVAGWTPGTPARNASRVLAGIPEPVELDLPSALADRIEGPTLLVYFSPTCPHCQHAQPELNDVARRIAGTGKVIGVSSGATSVDAMNAYIKTYKVAYPLIHDSERTMGAAMGARSTPSVLYVERKGKKILAKDAFYPFRSGTGSLLVQRVLGAPFAGFDPDRYHGTATCAACHVDEAASWMLTHHSVAWDTLLARDADKKEECVGCHVTGKDTPTGWAADGGRDHLVDVGCESCHGPGGPHDGKADVATESCAGCHDKKHSIAFSVEKGLPHLDHYRGAALDSEAFTAELRALHTGKKERPLLAFADGPHVGSKACAECHEAEHTWFEGDAHGRAMASLQGKEHEGAPASDAVACVKCHASPKRHGGPVANERSAFAVDEGGVGCESCHGPGGAHVAAGGGTDNIEGLGEDCPVCVLEALCTSCHTSEWDPGWVLESRLEAVKHR
ncbi:MAG: multiheme c-type cytochrome [Myxococcota bacterium]